MENRNILIIDDEEMIVEAIRALLLSEGYSVFTSLSGRAGLDILKTKNIDTILLDVMMDDMDGYELCRILKSDDVWKYIPIIMLTAKASLEDKIAGLDTGADDYLAKPFKNEELLAKIRVMLRIKNLHDELRFERAKNVSLNKNLQSRYQLDKLVGKSPKIQKIFDLITSLAETDTTVLIQGESGTGKELVARAIHSLSNRCDEALIVVNCSAYPEGLLESELFGHEKGAFTGAIKQKLGRFELAHKGTLFLDEIGDISPRSQLLLLRAIQEKQFERVGGEQTISVNVRIVAATNKNLEMEMKKGNFREDLYYRLNVVSLNLPSLRERKEDIPLLAEHFLEKFTQEKNKQPLKISQEALKQMMNYNWPGNIRELENAIERAVVLAKDNYIQSEDMPNISSDEQPASSSLAENEKQLIKSTLAKYFWNKYQTAKELKITRSTLYSKMRKYGLL
jgi:DNA-binding NtrC family response regulator